MLSDYKAGKVVKKSSAVVAIARPCHDRLARRPYAGRVLAVHERTCNVIDADDRLLSLTLASVGNGPFSVVLSSESLPLMTPGDPVGLNANGLSISGGCYHFDQAVIWEPYLSPLPAGFTLPSALLARLRAYATWPHLEDASLAPLASALRRGGRTLQQSLAERRPLATAVAALVGLGSGLTPAGDDYLLGVMAALHLWRDDRLLSIAAAVGTRTTLLSRAFLEAAGAGLFAEPWHQLGLALRVIVEGETNEALLRIERVGATSGRDALTGFAQTVLAHLA